MQLVTLLKIIFDTRDQTMAMPDVMCLCSALNTNTLNTTQSFLYQDLHFIFNTSL